MVRGYSKSKDNTASLLAPILPTIDVTDDEIERSISKDTLNEIPIARVACYTYYPTTKKNHEIGDCGTILQSLGPRYRSGFIRPGQLRQVQKVSQSLKQKATSNVKKDMFVLLLYFFEFEFS